MKSLSLFNLEQIDHIVSPDNFIQTTLNSMATEVFTDFKDHQALVIKSNTPAADALNLMIQEHVQMKIVVSANGDFLGVISTAELSERRIVSEVAKGIPRDEILVTDLMVARENLRAFEYQELCKAKVSDVIQALKDNGLRHCLVVDRHDHHIRGVISSSDIARKLRLPIAINSATSFNKIFEVVHGYKIAS